LTSKDQESKASFEKFGCEQNEMMFARWMTFLTSIICAIFGMDPAEVNSEGFSAGASPLSGSDTAERLAASKDKGLRPLLAYFENLFTDYVVHEFSDKFVMRFTGLDEEDEEKRYEMRKLVLTVDEARAQEGYEAHEDPAIGKAPLNPSLTGLYMQSAGIGQDQGEQEEQEDFGNPDDEDKNPKDAEGDQEGDGDANEPSPENNSEAKPNFGKPQEQDFGKSLADAERFGMPVIRIGEY
jgi:hypothetical protein